MEVLIIGARHRRPHAGAELHEPASPAASTRPRRRSSRSASASTSCRTARRCSASWAWTTRSRSSRSRRASRSSSTASASSSTASRPGATPATSGRSSRSIAATCRWCCSRRSGRARRGPPASRAGSCTGVEQDANGRHRAFRFTTTGEAASAAARRRRRSRCDGIHSAIRKQLYPDEGAPRYSGVNMWRGVTRWKPFLTGASMVRAGWLKPRQDGDLPDPQRDRRRGPPARQLGRRDRRRRKYEQRDWNRPGELEDFIAAVRGLALRLARRAGDDPRRRT